LTPEARDKLGRFSMRFDLLEILPSARMHQILREKLAGRGFVEQSEGMVLPDVKDASIVFDIEAMTLHLRLKSPDGMTVRVIDDALPEWTSGMADAIEKGELLSPELTRLAQQELGHQAAARLRDLALELRATINSALKETYRDAITEKAATLGSVSNISETSDGSTFRIRIEIQG
jgi:hypothetical protein